MDKNLGLTFWATCTVKNIEAVDQI